jgi:3-hydroxybutyryl-CoA dehydrogenase
VSIERIGIAGAGLMGGGIAQLFAAHGRGVRLWDAAPGAGERALSAIRARLEVSAAKGHLPASEVGPILQRVTVARELEELADCELAVEAISEDLRAKRRLLAALSAALAAPAPIGTNTSSLSVRALARSVRGPERFLGMHFFNPPTRLQLVELVPVPATSGETLARVRELLEACGKSPVKVRDSPGFIVNRLLLLMINEAARMVDEGVASPEDIDAAMRLGALHPAGPLAVADLIGLDTCRRILASLRRGLRNPAFRAARGLRRRVAEGRLGSKSGEGFFSPPPLPAGAGPDSGPGPAPRPGAGDGSGSGRRAC